MTTKQYLPHRQRYYIVGIVTLLVWAQIAWQYFNGGVLRHYLLHRDDLPSFSNWWGVITIPIVTCFLLGRIAKYVNAVPNKATERSRQSLFLFLGGLLFSSVLSLLFTLTPESALLGYLPFAVIALSLFFPLYRAAFMLGYVLGLVYSFGGVLPLIIAVVFALIFVIAYKLVRQGVLLLFKK